MYIYALYSNLSDELKYVGKCNDPKQRLRMHYSQRNCKKSHKNNWINSVIRNGGDIQLKIIEEVNEYNWVEREIFWINEISKTNNLTNIAKGGLGGQVKKYNITYNEMVKLVPNNIKSKTEWYRYTKSKEFSELMPKDPVQYFKSEWISWGDFLGTGRIQDNKTINYISYESAKVWLIDNNIDIKSVKNWKLNLDKIPSFIPKRPDRYYKNRNWVSWPDFLGNKRIANRKRNIIKYTEAKELIRKLNITNIIEYKEIQSKLYINELPVHPHLTYKNKGFINYEEFFK